MMQQECNGKMDPMQKEAVQEALAALIKKMLGDDSEGEGGESAEMIAEAKPSDEEKSADDLASEAENEGESMGDEGLEDELKSFMNPKREPKRALMMAVTKIKGENTPNMMAEQRKAKGKYLG